MATAYYRGLAFPFVKGNRTLPAPVTDDELVRQSILQILMTSRGERVMRPLFGSNLYTFVFENNSELTSEMLRVEISSAVARFESRVSIQDIFFEREDTTLKITVDFIALSTRTLNTVQVAVPTVGPQGG